MQKNKKSVFGLFFLFRYYIDLKQLQNTLIMRYRKKSKFMNLIKIFGLICGAVIFQKNILELLQKIPVIGKAVTDAKDKNENQTSTNS